MAPEILEATGWWIGIEPALLWCGGPAGGKPSLLRRSSCSRSRRSISSTSCSIRRRLSASRSRLKASGSSMALALLMEVGTPGREKKGMSVKSLDMGANA